MENEIAKIISFYGALNRSLTILEIWRLLPASVRAENSLSTIIDSYGEISLERKKQDLLADKKWKKFLKYSRLFSFIPFLEFVFGAGSLALGNVHSDSDFDVLIGAKFSRIFTTRFFTMGIFTILGIRRKRLDHKENAKDKICLNHFVTEKSYCLKPPYNYYWQNLYKNLVPIYGKEEKISEFYKANNSWLDFEPVIADYRWNNRENFLKNFLEFILGGFFGDILEKILRYVQLRRINKKLDFENINSRLVYNDIELEFHPDISRIEKILKEV